MNEENKDSIMESSEQPEQDQKDPAKDEKTFTSAEVNEIVRKRLERERAKHQGQQSATDAELTAKANRLECKEYILDNGLSMDLLDVIDTGDVAAFKEKADKINSLVAEGVKAHVSYPDVQDAGEPYNISASDTIKTAFSKKGAAHKPKEWTP